MIYQIVGTIYDQHQKLDVDVLDKTPNVRRSLLLHPGESEQQHINNDL